MPHSQASWGAKEGAQPGHRSKPGPAGGKGQTAPAEASATLWKVGRPGGVILLLLGEHQGLTAV